MRKRKEYNYPKPQVGQVVWGHHTSIHSKARPTVRQHVVTKVGRVYFTTDGSARWYIADWGADHFGHGRDRAFPSRAELDAQLSRDQQVASMRKFFRDEATKHVHEAYFTTIFRLMVAVGWIKDITPNVGSTYELKAPKQPRGDK